MNSSIVENTTIKNEDHNIVSQNFNKSEII